MIPSCSRISSTSYLTFAPRPPYVSEPGLARALEDMAADDPRVAAYQPSDFIDSRYLRELEAAGALASPAEQDLSPSRPRGSARVARVASSP